MVKKSILVLCYLMSLISEVWSTDESRYEYSILEDKSAQCSEKRQVLKIALPNGLRVFLLSDPSLQESAGAISVGVGSWDDPTEHSGMAHFVEHLLFLGTEAYPDESDFMKYIQMRGGDCNASTSRDRSLYGFSIQSEWFEGALDRFSHLFIDPLFTKSAVEREVHAVHHEFEDNIENEFFRIWRVFKQTGNPSHPNVNFSCGNLESLKGVRREDISLWFQQHYLPSHMRLVLTSPKPLKELIDLTCRFFSKIPERKTLKSSKKAGYEESMSDPSQRGHLIHVDSSFNSRFLSMIWEVPKEFMDIESAKLFDLIQMALNHGYANSLSKLLEEEGLAEDVQVEFWKVEKNHGIFRINIALTKNGLAQYEEVIKMCFQALKFFKESTIPEYLVRKVQGFKRDRSLLKSFQGAMEIAEDLIDELIETYPGATSVSLEETSSKVPLLFLELTSAECMYFLVAPTQESGVMPSEMEKWMGAKYLVRKIAEGKIQQWNEERAHPLIGFQPEEELAFNDKNGSQEKLELTREFLSEPVFVIDDARARIRLVEVFPKEDVLEAFFCVATPLIGSSIENTTLTELFTELLNKVLELEFGVESELTWEVSMEGSRLYLLLRSPKALVVEHFRRFFTTLRDCQMSSLQFEEIKKDFLCNYEGDPFPLEYAQQILDSCLSSFYYTKMELYQSMSNIFFADYKEFEKTCFNEVFIEGAFLGALSKEEASSLFEEIYSVFSFLPYDSYESQEREFVLPEESQSHLIFQKTHRKGNALLLLVLSKETDEKSLALHRILTIFLRNEFFNEIRTSQQIAYKLSSWSEFMLDHMCHCFSLQSSTYDPLYLLNKVEGFLGSMVGSLESKLTVEKMNLIQEALISKLEKQIKPEGRDKDNRSITNRIKTLKSIGYIDVLNGAKEIFSFENRKRIAILIEGKGSSELVEADFVGINYTLRDKDSFRQ